MREKTTREIMEKVDEILVTDIRESYLYLRLCDPAEEGKMEESLRRYGQISPIVVWEPMEGGCELIDGFKRVHAWKKINKESHLSARMLRTSIQSAKAAILYLNWITKSVTDLEEAFVVRSLVREEKMLQSEVAELFQKDKSWVSRRLSLAEKLSEKVIDEMRLGLISKTTGRELAKLPRGNQEKILGVIVGERLSTREVSKLVMTLDETEKRQWDEILAHPREAQREGALPMTPDARLSRAGNRLKKEAVLLVNAGSRLRKGLNSFSLPQYSETELAILAPHLGKALGEARRVIDAIEGAQKHVSGEGGGR